MSLSQKQANRLRGLICFALECAADNAHAGAQDPHTAMHIKEQYLLSVDHVWVELRKLTEEVPKYKK